MTEIHRKKKLHKKLPILLEKLALEKVSRQAVPEEIVFKLEFERIEWGQGSVLGRDKQDMQSPSLNWKIVMLFEKLIRTRLEVE